MSLLRRESYTLRSETCTKHQCQNYLIVQGQLCTICKNRAPHVNFCHPVVLKSYGSKVSKKIGWQFFQTRFKVISRSYNIKRLKTDYSCEKYGLRCFKSKLIILMSFKYYIKLSRLCLERF